MEPEQEHLLVERAKTDPNAFGILYEEYYVRIFGYVLRRTANLQNAQDITASVFFNAYKNVKRFEWKGLSFSSFLYRIAANEITNNYRHDGREKKYLESVCNSVTTLEIQNAQLEVRKYEDYLILHEAISKLPGKYQEVIALKYFEDKEIREISEILGKPEGTVKSLLHRGIVKLKRFLE